MKSQSLKKLDLIHQEIFEKSREEDEENKISRDKIRRVIEDVAGMTDSIVEKYLGLLKDRDRISELEEDVFVVEAPGDVEADVDLTDKSAQVQVTIDQNVKDMAKEQGLNISQVTEDALLDRLVDWQDFFKKTLNEELSEKEVEFVRRLANHPENLQDSEAVHPAHIDHEEYKRRRGKLRREIYREVFGENYPEKPLNEYIDDLRKVAFRLVNET